MTMTVNADPGSALAVRAQPILPLAPEDAKQAMAAYQELSRAILTEDDLQPVDGKSFVKRSGFSKLAAAYGVSTEIRSLEEERDDDGEILRARAVVRAFHQGGRHAEGDGACARAESRFGGRGAKNIDHNLPATAVTRATNRAISNLIAFGQVSAEEAETDAGGPGPGRGSGSPAWASHVGDVGLVARSINTLLESAGVTDADVTSQVGQTIFDDCGGIPICVAQTIDHINAAIAAASTPVDAETVDGNVETTTE